MEKTHIFKFRDFLQNSNNKIQNNKTRKTLTGEAVKTAINWKLFCSAFDICASSK